MTDRETRRRWISLGETIAIAALMVSAVGVWIAWQSSNNDRPTRVVEQRSAVPLALRGTTDGEGRTLTITPGIKVCQVGLQFGADDVGSILIEENVVYAAGVRNRTNESELRRIISDAGFIPAQRDTLYRSYALK